MTFDECAAYLDGIHEVDKDNWERTRQIMYAIIQVNSTSELDPTDILRFDWDTQVNDSDESDRGIEDVRERMKNIKL